MQPTGQISFISGHAVYQHCDVSAVLNACVANTCIWQVDSESLFQIQVMQFVVQWIYLGIESDTTRSTK